MLQAVKAQQQKQKNKKNNLNDDKRFTARLVLRTKINCNTICKGMEYILHHAFVLI